MHTLGLHILSFVLKKLAQMTLWRYTPGIVGVTGSVGKTTTKEMLRVVVGKDRRVRASSGSFNNELGLPLTILGDWKTTGGIFFWCRVCIQSIFNLIFYRASYPEVLILEYGVDGPGNMDYLLSIAKPHVGVFTAMADIPVHVEFFPGPESVFKEKLKLFTQLPVTGFGIFNADDDRIMSARDHVRGRIVTFGFSPRADVRILSFTTTNEHETLGITFKLSYGGNVVPVRLSGIFGKTQSYAVAATVATGLIFGMHLIKIVEAIEKEYIPPPGRLRMIPGIKESVIIDDTYNASPIAVREALTALHDVPAKRRIAVLGDMLELGKYTLEAHESIGKIVGKCTDIVITIGLRGKFIAEAALRAGFPKKSVHSFMQLHEAGVFLQEKIQKGDVILVKGSQGVRMERIVKEVMADPLHAEELLVRQNVIWCTKPGLYDVGKE